MKAFLGLLLLAAVFNNEHEDEKGTKNNRCNVQNVAIISYIFRMPNIQYVSGLKNILV